MVRLATVAVPAGFPSPSEDYWEPLDLTRHLIDRPASTYLVRVTGWSMQGAPADCDTVQPAIRPPYWRQPTPGSAEAENGWRDVIAPWTRRSGHCSPHWRPTPVEPSHTSPSRPADAHAAGLASVPLAALEAELRRRAGH